MEKIVPTYIEDELRKSYLDYAMSVIVGRALPDVRDGLKPVHRRILYSMYRLGLWHNKGFRKCATVVGEVLGKFHPHGDLSVYDALTRMVQNFSLRHPLLQGKGNFGSIDGDSPAAYRYTETKLNEIAEMMLKDIEKGTVAMKANFDDTLEEPSVLPSQFPNLLVNGSSGIAVGMATNIPPHNLNEVIDALVALIDNPELDNFSKYIEGPDFPTGGIITGHSGIKEAYATGRGKVILKADAQIEELNGKPVILVTEIPYQVNKSALISQIADLARDKKIEGISDIRDESAREGIRVVIELKRSAHPQIVLNRLFKHTQMQTTYGIILLALQNGEPKILTLKAILSAFLDHRFKIVKSRSEFELKEAEREAHILEGLKKAIANIDEVVKIIRSAKSSESAQAELIATFKFSKEQTHAILDMRLARLVALEREKLETEYKERLALIKNLKQILSSKENIMNVVKKELFEIKKKFGNPRRTKIVFSEEKELEIEDLIPDEPVFIILTDKGYIKRSKSGVYPRQHRAGKGVAGIKLVLEDKVNKILFAKTHSDLIFFTNLGRCYKAKVYELPEGERSTQGKSLANLFPFKEDERVEGILPVESFARGATSSNQRIVIATKKGVVKQMELANLQNIRKSGIIAISLREGDKVAGTILVEPKDWIVMVTRNGKVIRFKESLLRLTSRTSQGVRGIRIRGEDEVITLEPIKDMKLLLLFVTRSGYCKRTPVASFRETNRGGVGIIGSKEELAGCELVTEDMEVIITTQNGGTLRTYVKDIRRKGRPARGVKLINLKEGDKVKDMEVLCAEN